MGRGGPQIQAGFTGATAGPMPGGRGGPQIQSPLGALLAARGYGGGGGGWGYGPQDMDPRKRYQMAQGAAGFQRFGEPRNQNDMGLGGLGQYQGPEAINQGHRGSGATFDRMRAISGAARGYGGSPMPQGGGQGFGFADPGDALRRLLAAQLGGGF